MSNDELMSRWAPTLLRGPLSTPQVNALAHERGDDLPAGNDDVATDEPTERTGVMVAFYLDDDSSQDLAIDGGEPCEELHLTLAFLGTVGAQIPLEAEGSVIDIVSAWAAATPPLEATVSGVGYFIGDPTITYASIDAPMLASSRQRLVDLLRTAGFPPNTEHGYTPHVTLAYGKRDVDIAPFALEFDTVAVVFAGSRTYIRLNGPDADDHGGEQINEHAGSTRITTSERVPAPVPVPAPVVAKAFVADVNGRTLITAPATAAYKDPPVEDITDQHLLWMHGKFVGAEVPNRNGALWSAGDLQMARATVTNGPLNWLHEARHVIGTLAKADYVAPKGSVRQKAADLIQPHITATAAIWRWLWPDEAYVVQQASDQQNLWYSMECISKEVGCTGPDGCGRITSYASYMAGAACEHVTQRASVRQFINPVFLGGAVIVPPTRPGWAEADASVMNMASGLAEAAFEQAGQPDVAASDWEQMMAQLVRFGVS